MSTLPTITVDFLQQAYTAITRSTKGVMLIALKKDEFKASSDPTETEGATYEFYNAASVDANTHLNAIHKIICKFAFYKDGAPRKVVVAVSATGSGAVEAAREYEYAWACAGTDSHDVFEPVFANAILTMNQSNARKVKVCIKDNVPSTGTPSVAADDHVVRVNRCRLTFNDGTDEIPVMGFYQYMPRICATFCNTPITESATYKIFNELKSTSGTVAAGNDVSLIFKDGYVRMTRAITSSGKSVALIEAKDIISEDVYLTWMNHYLGKKRNTYDNQMAFCGSVLGYFRQLQDQGVINPDEPLECTIDVASMREAHSSYYEGKSDDWVMHHPYGTEVYINCAMYLCDVMESLTFKIYLQ